MESNRVGEAAANVHQQTLSHLPAKQNRTRFTLSNYYGGISSVVERLFVEQMTQVRFFYATLCIISLFGLSQVLEPFRPERLAGRTRCL